MAELSGLMENLARERVFSELDGLLPHLRAEDLIRYSTVLCAVIPELRATLGFDQRTHHHIYDIYTHTAHVVANVPATSVLRWAALLHDIATPVFSHVVDFLRGDHEKQESTESGTEALILGSRELLAVFEKYGIDPQRVTDYHIYPIADNDSPRLSADRLEYTLGNIVNFGFGTEETVKTYYEDLTATDEELVFRTPETAAAFARDALRCGHIYVSDADRFSMQTLADILQKAVAAGRLTEADFYTREQLVIEKLVAADWESYRSLHALCRREDGLVIPAKKRYIDPCTQGGQRASKQDPVFAGELADFLAYSFDYGLCAIK